MRYLLAKEDSQNILKDLINSVRIDAGQEEFEEVEIKSDIENNNEKTAEN